MAEKEIYADFKMIAGSDVKDELGRDLLLKKVASFNNLPAQGESDGDIYLVLDEDTLYEWDEQTLTWKPPAAYAKGFTSGCRLIYDTPTSIKVASGVIEIKNKTLGRNTFSTLNWTTVDTGVTKQANSWYYVYLKADPTNPTIFVGFISNQTPTKDLYGNTISPDSPQAKYHPTLEARFVGSFKTDAGGNTVKFKVVGNYVSISGQGYNYLAQALASIVKNLLNVRTFVPYTSSICTVYYENAGGTGNYKYLGDVDTFSVKFKDGSGEVTLTISEDNIALGKTATASNNNGNAPKSVDGDTTTAWNAKNLTAEWLRVDLGAVVNLNKVRIKSNSTITSFTLQKSLDGTTFTTITTGTNTLNDITFPTVSTRYVRLLINTSSALALIYEFEIFNGESNSIYYKVDGDSINLGIHGYYEDI